MAIEAATTDIDLGYHDECYTRSSHQAGVARGSTATTTSGVETGDEPGYTFHPLLREPVDVTVKVKTLYPSPPSTPALPGGGGGASAECGGAGSHTRESANSAVATPAGSGARKRSSGDNAPGSSSGSGATAVNVAAEEIPVRRPSRGDGDQGDSIPASAGTDCGGAGEDARPAAAAGGEDAEQERTMQVRVELPNLLRLSLTPDARAALTGCIGGNVLAVGFHGEISEDFPLLGSPSPSSSLSMDGGAVGVPKRSGGDEENDDGAEVECIEYEMEGRARMKPRRAEGSPKLRNREEIRRGGSGGRGGAANPSFPYAGAVQLQQQQYPSPPPSSSGTAIGSRGEGEGAPLPLACPVCADSFDELLARHECSWCEGMVCRKCMHTQVGVLRARGSGVRTLFVLAFFRVYTDAELDGGNVSYCANCQLPTANKIKHP